MASAGKRSSASGISTRAGRRRRKPARRFAVCIDSSGYPASLELHKIYRVIPDEDAVREGDLRIIDESGDDYLYPAKRFILVELPRAIEASLRRAS